MMSRNFDDLAGQVVSVTDANGNSTSTEYDTLGRAIRVVTPFSSSTNGETKTYYDKNSNVVKTAVKRNSSVYQTTEYKYDKMGNLLASIANDESTDIVTQYEYDTANRVTKMITGLSEYSENPTGGSVTQYNYDSLGHLSEVTDPMGLIETYYEYDYADNLLMWSDRNGNVIYNKYGAYGLTKTYFMIWSDRKEYTYNSIGQLTGTSSVSPDGTEVTNSYTYDAFGRMVSSTSDDGSVQNYTYDSNSNVTAYELIKDDVTENSIAYEYNNLNRLTELTNNGIITSYTYDANGNLTEKSDDNGVTTSYAYNAANLLTKLTCKNGSTAYRRYSMSYYLDGLKSAEADDVNSYNKVYFYDNAGRLKEEFIYDTLGEFNMDSNYEYDTYGNRTLAEVTNSDNNVTIENYTYDANNRLTDIAESYKSTPGGTAEAMSATKYYYDDNGNTLAKQVTSYTSGTESSNMGISGRSPNNGMEIYGYDAFNRLISYNSGANEATYTYDADNLRTSKTVDREKTTFVWNNGNLASETTDSAVNTYTYDATGVYIANQNGTVTSYLKDAHGNIAAKTDSSGAMIEALDLRSKYGSE
ncbi:MAG: hypothetical protein LUD03_02835 [Firmicutes bacterium]|nr:hypothetical protein [Bacillota bacterium]